MSSLGDAHAGAACVAHRPKHGSASTASVLPPGRGDVRSAGLCQAAMIKVGSWPSRSDTGWQ